MNIDNQQLRLMKTNFIINQDDSRYGKLGHLWKSYSLEDLTESNYWFIPPELIINEYTDSRGRRFSKDKSSLGQWDNWISTYFLEERLFFTTGLSTQEYYDLLILKINNISDRPKCYHPRCKSYTKFYSMSKGYSSFCCQGCASSVTMTNLNLDWWSGTRVNKYVDSIEMFSLVEAGHLHRIDSESDYESRYLYLVKFSDKFKVGTLRSLEDSHYEIDKYIWNKYPDLISFEVFLGPKSEVVDLELSIKLLNKDHRVLPKRSRGWTETFPIQFYNESRSLIKLPELTI